MADRYLVLIVDPDEFDWNTYYAEGKDQYELYSLYKEGKELPDGVRVETWLVEDGESWDSSPLYEQHSLVKEDCYLIEWDEVNDPTGIKEESFWAERKTQLKAAIESMRAVTEGADNLIGLIHDLLDPDYDQLNDFLNGRTETRDWEVLGFYLYLLEEKVE